MRHSRLFIFLAIVLLSVGCAKSTAISHLLEIALFGKGYITNFVFCVLGAITVLWLWKKLFR